MVCFGSEGQHAQVRSSNKTFIVHLFNHLRGIEYNLDSRDNTESVTN